LRSKLESLLETLNNSPASASTGSSSAAASASVASLNTTFNKLMTDAGVAYFTVNLNVAQPAGGRGGN